MSTLRTLAQLSTRMSFRRRMEYKTPSPTSVMSTLSFPKDDDDNEFSRSTQQHQRRHYYETARREILYPAMIIVAAVSYVGYKKYHGLPLTPKSSTEGQEAYRKLEEDRVKRNLKNKQGRNKKEGFVSK
jgi:hypothetical protein